MLHVPIAGDIAATSANLLFSEAPTATIPEAHEESAPPGAVATQERLDELIEVGGLHNRLLEAAESCAALGGVYLRPVWDREVADHPILSVVQADAAVPEFRWGVLRAVTLWRVVEDDGRIVWRHLERHEVDGQGRGIILHGLYRGTSDSLGTRMDLSAHPETTKLEPVVRLPFEGLGIRYVPNMRPNRRFRGTALGQSDYAGSEGLMDALDEVYTSWLRDIRLARARIVVPEEWLERRDGPDGRPRWIFDLDREIFTSLNIDPASAQSAGITPSQFAIRTEEHARAALELLDRIISAAGYSPQSFGLKIEGRAESGTALRLRERKSLVTREKKARYWKPALEDVLQMMLAIDREVFGNTRIDPSFRPRVEIADSIVPDVTEVAQAVDLLARAQAASIETRVRMVHPDWSPEEVAAEVQRIREEQGLSLPDPIQTGIA